MGETICEGCGAEIEEDEVQSCGVCGMDGLGNCCIGVLDHDCLTTDEAEAEPGDDEGEGDDGDEDEEEEEED